MNRLRDIFPCNTHVILPVIHVASLDQTLHNAELAFRLGSDGVFLINHAIPAEKLIAIAESTVNELPNAWVGVNCLDLSPAETFGLVPDGIRGVWVDNAGILGDEEAQTEALEIQSALNASKWDGLYFGGVDFKYQRPADDAARAAELATDFVDVVTTSGPATGVAAPVRKIASMRRALGEHPLAVASGISPDNVTEYLPYADCFLVATGISRSWSELDPDKLAALVRAVRLASRTVAGGCIGIPTAP